MKSSVKPTVSLLSSVLFLCVAADLHAPVVHTKLGSLRGTYVSVKGKESGAHAYLGIPFAKPPVGPALRLAAPQPVEGWKGVRDATQQPPMCVQNKQFSLDLLDKLGFTAATIPDISEDCLYLNIYTPANRADNAKLPVMVWIHGGGLVMGSASAYDGSALAAYQDVVVVLIQYRLGLLGFLSTGDEHLSGNFGLLDQIQALRWTQEHIHNFGGDPGLVTIFGESAGGVSVSLLLLSPLSEGLFHHAIAESGTAAMPSLTIRDTLPMAQMAANASGCGIESSERIAQCMKNLDMDAVLTIVQNDQMRFPASVDGLFLTKTADELFHDHELLTVPFMTGVNDDEGGWLLGDIWAPSNWTEGMDREHIMNILSMFYPNPQDKLSRELILDEYTGTGEDRVRNRDGFTRLVGDLLFTIPAIKTINAHRDAGAPVYLYEYQHAPSFLQSKRPNFVKSDHGDEIFTVFGLCFTTTHVELADGCSEEDEQLSRIMMNYWGNFARTGSPNGEGLVHWPKYGAEEKYLEIDAKQQVTRQHLKKDQFVFLTQTLPEKVQQHEMKHAPVVHTKLGSLRGTYVSVKGKESGVHAYLGIPFAKPPVGPALRLAAPQPVEGWEGVRDATQQPPICVQNRAVLVDLLDKAGLSAVTLPDISEDCLYLNIYTPANRADNAKLPVMVYIHGGGFASGSASLFDGSALAAYQDVVVVLIQYRVGLLGFLSTGDKHLPGNFGLLDQIQALRWTQEHIHNFGGDPGLVTIFGESAGGASVSLLLLSPLSEGLFHHAIAESGVAAINAVLTSYPLPMAQMAANASGCSLESSEKIAQCMKNLDMDAVLNIVENGQMTFVVSVDGLFLTKPVDELLHEHKLLTVPFMTGVNNDEGGWLIPGFFLPPDWPEGLDRDVVVNMMSVFFPDPTDSFSRELVTQEYVGTGEDRVKNRDGFTEALGDLMFTIPAIKTVNAHRDAGAPVYLYEFQYAPSFMQSKRPSFVKSDHADENFAVFGFCFSTAHGQIVDGCSEEDEQMCRIIMNYFGNFARTGSPNGEGLVHWPKYGAEEKYLEIDAKLQVTRQHLKKDRFVFLTQTLPEKVREHEKKEHSEL
ncbi:uncharacterized protein V6R79_003148 [Siganus canaliculatus]